MPKVIEDIRTQLITQGRNILIKEGFDKLTIRSISKDCGIGTGTVYYYFKDKEDLLAAIVMEDWQQVIEIAHDEIFFANSFMEGIETINENLSPFIYTYSESWSKFGVDNNPIAHSNQWKNSLLKEICKLIEMLEERFPQGYGHYFVQFLGETILNNLINPFNTFDDLRPILEKLIH